MRILTVGPLDKTVTLPKGLGPIVSCTKIIPEMESLSNLACVAQLSLLVCAISAVSTSVMQSLFQDYPKPR